jgi:hypothetical protein
MVIFYDVFEHIFLIFCFYVVFVPALLGWGYIFAIVRLSVCSHVVSHEALTVLELKSTKFTECSSASEAVRIDFLQFCLSYFP